MGGKATPGGRTDSNHPLGGKVERAVGVRPSKGCSEYKPAPGLAKTPNRTHLGDGGNPPDGRNPRESAPDLAFPRGGVSRFRSEFGASCKKAAPIGCRFPKGKA